MLVLNKSSRIKCDASVLNQCKDVAHAEYDYEVKLITPEVLDNRGFVIDHSDIHKIVKNIFDTRMGSCEQLTIRIGEALKTELDSLKIPVNTIEVAVKPVSSNAHVCYVKNFKTNRWKFW